MKKRSPIVSNKQLAVAMAALGLLQEGAFHQEAYAAGSNTSTLSIQASITAQCYVDNATMSFSGGVFSPDSALASAAVINTLTASAFVPVLCTNGSTGALSTSAAVTLTGAASTGNLLTATLYDTSIGGSAFPTPITYTGVGTIQSLTVAGQIIPTSATKADTYTGSVPLTISY